MHAYDCTYLELYLAELADLLYQRYAFLRYSVARVRSDGWKLGIFFWCGIDQVGLVMFTS